MITMTAKHAQRPLRSGKSPSQELDADTQLRSRPPSSVAPPLPLTVNLEQLAATGP